MSASSMGLTRNRTLRFYESSIGKKAVMAATGCILFLFVLGHMIGNLQIYLGADQLNLYAEKLRDLGALLWVIRGFLLAVTIIHIIAAIQLWLMNRAARPVNYTRQGWVQASFASRTMIISGPLLGAFILYHILHFTTGHFLPGGLQTLDGGHIDVYANVVKGFTYLPATLVYLVAMVVLGYHLSHGVWSMFQSVGFNHPRYTPIIQKLALAVTIIIVAGNISIPLAVLAGIIR